MSSKEVGTLTLEDGRVLTICDLDPGDVFGLIECMPKVSDPSVWMGYASPIASVTKIDGRPIPFPTSNDKIKARARELGGPGVQKLQEFFSSLTGAEDTAPPPVEEVAKN